MENIKHINDLFLKFNKDKNSTNNNIKFFLTVFAGIYGKKIMYLFTENHHLETTISNVILKKRIPKKAQ